MITILTIRKSISLWEFPDKYIITVYGNNLSHIEPLIVPEQSTLHFSVNGESVLEILFHSRYVMNQVKLTKDYFVIELVSCR